MTEENGVKVEEAVTSPVPAEDNEQVDQPEDGVTPPTDGKDYKRIAEQLSKDIKEKNRKIQELKSKTAEQVVEPRVPQVSEDDTVRRFIQTEANATIAVKLQTDPTFKDRVSLVQEYVAQGYDVNMADKLAKSDIMDNILNTVSQELPAQPTPKQITPQAIPEKQVVKETGDGFKDFLSDPNVPEGAKEAVRRAFSDRL